LEIGEIVVPAVKQSRQVLHLLLLHVPPKVELILGKNVYFLSSTMGLFTMLALMLEGSPSLGVQPG